MRLAELNLAGFQSYGEAQTLILDEEVTFLAGRNDVGKTALMRVFADFGKWRAVELPPEFSVRAVWQAGRHEFRSSDLRGILADVIPEQSDPITISATFEKRGGTTSPAEVYLEGVGRATGLPGTNLGWDGGPIQGALGTSELARMVTAAGKRAVYVGPRVIEAGRRSLRAERELRSDGSNLAGVLYRLQNNDMSTTFRQLTEFMSSAFPDIEVVQIRLEEDESTPMGEPYVIYRDRSDPIPLRDCGSGVEQLLAIAVSVMTAEEPRLIMIDEPQAYLHPQGERSLMKLLERNAEHQYLIATHSGLLLNSRPLSQSRLVLKAEGQSRIVAPAESLEVLGALQLTATDLWHKENLLWVEGPSEEVAIGVLAAANLQPSARAGLTIRRMPVGVSNFTKGKRAEAAYRFCDEVSKAISPAPLNMRFLFDRDEKTDEERSRINDASNDRARFLSVRELENCYLDASLLHEVLSELASGLELEIPSREAVSALIDSELGKTDDKKLYPGGTGEPGKDAKGSELLNRIWWRFLKGEYDKVGDGERLARAVVRSGGDQLDELREELAFVDEGADASAECGA